MPFVDDVSTSDDQLMQQSIKDRYTDHILHEAMRRYGITKDQIRSVDAFESFIYEYERDSQAYILRINHSLRRSEALILGEVDWINYLAANGLSVARAVASEAGKLVEAIEDGQGGHFLVTAFVKARGSNPWEISWTPSLYEAYGRLIGKMHALSTQYQPADPSWKRPDWDHEMMEFVERYLPASEAVAKSKYKQVLDHVRGLPIEKSSYGLIHQDAHEGNFLVDENGTITLFDFDECVYSWFINDIAIVLFYAVQGVQDPPAFTREFMTHFLRGYRQAHPLEAKWLHEIPFFMKLREIELYAVVHRDFDVNSIDHEWFKKFMRGRKDRIRQDVPVIEFDFQVL